MLFNVITAPDGPPEDVRGWPISPTQISVQWAPPLIINRLGVITSYDIMYTATDMNGALIEIKWINETTDTYIVLNELHEYTNYSVFVRARTAEGPGPLSAPINMILTQSNL